MAPVRKSSVVENKPDEVGKHDLAESEKNCVFLDRDGVLNEPVVRDGLPYPPAMAEQVHIYDDVVGGCKRLKAAGFLLVVITNQPDVGRGLQTRAAVDRINQKLATAIPLLDRFETCFHAGEKYGQSCQCRKPKPGMLYQAAKLMNINLSQSFVVGDRWRDVGCAKAAGCRSVFIEHGYSEPLLQQPDVIVTSFSEAVEAIFQLANSDSLLKAPPPV
jgi:D-glycero-D-manno-heptose 1,7-bisphosphate phosphatase